MNKQINIILPCFNEEKSLGFCIDEIRKVSKENRLSTEIIVVDNNSTDRSSEIAKEKEVQYIFEKNKGYGNAYLAGLKSVNREIIIMADCDGSYDFNDIPNFLNELENNDLIVGNRLNKNFLPLVNRIGGFLINKMLRLRGLKIKESCTGFIGIKKNKINLLRLEKQGMEFSSELLVKAKQKGLKIQEIDVNFRKRIGKSKLRIFKDGFRHLKFLLLEN